MQKNTKISAANRRRNTYKAIENLWGICLGICSDKALNLLELKFLEIWLLDNVSFIDSPETANIYHIVSQVLENNSLTDDHKYEIKIAIDNFIAMLEPDSRRGDLLAEAANRLFGFVHGIMADQQLKDLEIIELKKQLDTMPSAEWPWNHLRQQVTEVLSDNIITSEERQHLITVLNDICNSNILETGSATAMTITLGAIELDSIEFEGSSFCFTGKFAFGTRASCLAATKLKGGLDSKNVTLKTNYLVLGTHVSPDWISTSFGRKIQKAKDIQAKGSTLKIITEATWAKFL